MPCAKQMKHKLQTAHGKALKKNGALWCAGCARFPAFAIPPGPSVGAEWPARGRPSCFCSFLSFFLSVYFFFR